MAKKTTKNKAIEFVREVDNISHSKRKNIKARIQSLFKRQPEQRIATTLDIDPEHRNLIFTSLTKEQKEQVLDLVNNHTLRSIVSHLSDHEVVDLIEQSPSMVSQKVIGVTERSRLNHLLPMLVDEERRQNLLNFVNYPERAVGRIMQPEVPTVYQDMTVFEVLREIAGFDTSNGPIYQVYVVDDKNNFLGTVPISEIIKMPASHKVNEFYFVTPPAIRTNTTQSHAAQLFREYDLIEAPVLTGKKIAGRILVDDILDVIDQEFTEDVQKFAGITSEETLETPAATSSRRRLPWMIANIFLALIAVSTIMPFEATIAELTALAVLMPVISNMGGNIGIQSLTVSIRALADNKPQWQLVTKELNKELKVGIINGTILGSLLGIVGYIGWQNPYLGLVAGVALFINTIFASMIGGVLPIILSKLKKDPALMSGAILTTITDFFGFLIFLTLARIFFTHLV